MTMTISGKVGIDFDITETDTELPTGNIVQVHKVNTEISSLELDSTDIVASLSGFIGTVQQVIDLTNVVSQTGTGFELILTRNSSISFSSIKSILVHNTHTTKNINIEGLTNSFIEFETPGDDFVVFPNSAVSFVIPNGRDCTIRKLFQFEGSDSAVTFEMFILGS